MPREGRRLRWGLPLATSLMAVGFPSTADAHSAERGFVLILPTDYYIAGGATVVAASFLLIALVPLARLRVIEGIGWPLGKFPDALGTGMSLLSCLIMAGLIAAGHVGTQDPLANPLPLAVWTLWWIALTVAHALFGDLWAVLNPWRGLYVVAFRTPWLGRWLARLQLGYPDWLGYWPAFAFFFLFVWFELIFAAPRNPEILANALALYYLANLLGTLLFGPSAWLRYGEAFSIFFRIVSWLSPLNGRPRSEDDVKPGIVLTLPGLGLLHVGPLSLSGTAFVLLALSSVSFDGLSKTFWWLDLIGVNPLDFPGRSAVTVPNTLGLLALFALLLAAYVGAVWLGHVLAGRPTSLAAAIGGHVVSIVPIALGYHFAHYATAFLVDVQYAAVTFNDPFALGWDLFGLAEAYVTTSFLTDFHAVRRIWYGQVATIVIAHVVAVSIAHLIAIRLIDAHGTAIVHQIPLTVLMVGYTQFGLWLLSSPAAG